MMREGVKSSAYRTALRELAEDTRTYVRSNFYEIYISHKDHELIIGTREMLPPPLHFSKGDLHNILQDVQRSKANGVPALTMREGDFHYLDPHAAYAKTTGWELYVYSETGEFCLRPSRSDAGLLHLMIEDLEAIVGGYL